MVEINKNSINKILTKTPLLKKVIKLIFRGVLKKDRLHQVEIYNSWLKESSPTNDDLANQRNDSQLFTYRPLISVVTPTYNTPHKYLREMIESLIDQTYDNWELVIVDDASNDEGVRDIIREYAKNDRRIKYNFLSRNHHIAGATNEAFKIAEGEFVSLFDHDDLLLPSALFEIVDTLNKNKQLDLIYTDEDKLIDSMGLRADPYFKPDWNPDFLYSVNYITHLTTVRKSILDQVGGEDGTYNGAQDWELLLKIARHIDKKRIYHIPKILYSWRVHEASTAMSLGSKPYVVESQRKAIEADLHERGENSFSLKQDDIYPGQWKLSFNPSNTPKISIIVSGENKDSIRNHINQNTDYEDYEVVFLKAPYSYEMLKNSIKGEYVVFANHKLKITDSGWLSTMLGDAQRDDIGFVVAKYSSEESIFWNIKVLINDSFVSVLEKLNANTLTKHYYDTTRYNLPFINREATAMIGIEKFKSIRMDDNEDFNKEKVSILISETGCRHLYNPYVKV